MNKKKILLGSILKPVNDARMYEKFGISLSKNQALEVHIAGYNSSIPEIDKIQFYPLFSFSRISYKRLLAPWKFYNLLLKVKPDIIIVTTFELLLVTCTYKILFGAVILYDVQENYFRNLIYTKSFRKGFNYILAYLVRNIEYLTKPLINLYFLAEKTYANELNFIGKKYIILENKYKPFSNYTNLKFNFTPTLLSEKEKINFIYSGTLSEVYGIFKAIDLVKNMHKHDHRVTLIIIGYAAQSECLLKIKKAIYGHDFIKLIGGNKLVPHELIINEIRKADFGLVSYIPNKSTKNRMPTKMFEYMAHQVPMIVQNNPYWEERCKPYSSTFFIDYSNYNSESLIKKLCDFSFYPKGIDSQLFWEDEILLNKINEIL